MRDLHNKAKKSLVFSKWTRKSYAVFASLGKLVTIGHLSIDICKSFLSQKKNILAALTNNSESSDSEHADPDSLDATWIETLLLELGIVSLDEAYYLTNQTITFGQSPYFTLCRIWTFSFYTKS